jgi:hypothetical protein
MHMINKGCICGGTIAIVFSNKQQFAFGMVTSHDNNVSMDWWECPHHHALVNIVVLCLCFCVNCLCCGLCLLSALCTQAYCPMPLSDHCGRPTTSASKWSVL